METDIKEKDVLIDIAINLDRIASALEESNKMMKVRGGYHDNEKRA